MQKLKLFTENSGMLTQRQSHQSKNSCMKGTMLSLKKINVYVHVYSLRFPLRIKSENDKLT